MPLIRCPECNTEVSDRAETCVKCGYPINAPTSNAANSVESVAESDVFEIKSIPMQMEYSSKPSTPSLPTSAPIVDEDTKEDQTFWACLFGCTIPIIIICFIIAFFQSIFCNGDNKQPPPPPKCSYCFTPEEYYQMWAKNDLAAEQRWKNKQVEITGIINRVDGTAIMERPYVELELDWFGTFRCYFQSNSTNVLISLRTGQRITVTCQGGSTRNAVYGCSLK